MDLIYFAGGTLLVIFAIVKIALWATESLERIETGRTCPPEASLPKLLDVMPLPKDTYCHHCGARQRTDH